MARTGLITLDNVQVTGGVFTVQLDLGANALTDGNSAAGNLKLNPAILSAEDSFFEIGVRAGTSTGAYTVLTPRQPITAVPLAMRANTANNAFRAAYADNATNATNAANLGGTAANQFVQTNDARLSDARTPTAGSTNYIQNTTTQQNGNFNISGSGTIGGILTVGGTINGTVSNATNAAQLGGVAAGQYVQTNDLRLTDSRAPAAGSSNYIQNTTAQQAANFNVSGNGAVGGNLTVGGTLSSGCRTGFTAVANGRLCISETQPADTFYNAAQTCTNMGARLGNSADVALSFTLANFNYFAATNPSGEPIPKGWLADIISDNVRATWNANNPHPDFDGTPLDVNTGGTGGTAPRLLYRCVY